MSEQGFGRRDFLKSAVVGGAAAASTAIPQIESAQGQTPARTAAAVPAAAPAPAAPTGSAPGRRWAGTGGRSRAASRQCR